MATALTNLVHCTFISCQTKNIKPQLSLKSLLNLFKSSCGVFFTSLCTVFICDVCGKSDPLSPPVLRSSAPRDRLSPWAVPCALGDTAASCRLLPRPPTAVLQPPGLAARLSSAPLRGAGSWAVSSCAAGARGGSEQQGGGARQGPPRERAYRVLLAQPVELLELLRHQQLRAAHGAPDLAENCEKKRGQGGQLRSRARVTRAGCVCACACQPQTRTPPRPLPRD